MSIVDPKLYDCIVILEENIGARIIEQKKNRRVIIEVDKGGLDGVKIIDLTGNKKYKTLIKQELK